MIRYPVRHMCPRVTGIEEYEPSPAGPKVPPANFLGCNIFQDATRACESPAGQTDSSYHFENILDKIGTFWTISNKPFTSPNLISSDQLITDHPDPPLKICPQTQTLSPRYSPLPSLPPLLATRSILYKFDWRT